MIWQERVSTIVMLGQVVEGEMVLIQKLFAND
jgi:hypothetical protein